MIYKIKLNGEIDKDLLTKIQKEQNKLDIQDGIYELYDSLFVAGYCESYSRTRILFVAWTLSQKNIEFTIQEA